MLTPIQKAAVRHVIAWEQSPPESRLTHEAWAEQVGINKKTLERWRDEPEFRQALEAQRAALEESSDPYALIARTTALEQLMAMMNKKGLTVSEKRMVIKDIMDVTKHVDAQGDPVDYSDMTDDDLVAAVMNRDLSPLGMTEAELKRLVRGQECSTSPSEPQSALLSVLPASMPDSESAAETPKRPRGRPKKASE